MNRRYLASFAVAGGLLLSNQLLVQPPLLRLESDAPVINVAGRQRMLSQRLAKAALALAATDDGAERLARRDELSDVLDLWSASQEVLKRGNRALAPGGTSPQVASAFDGIEPYFARMRTAAKRLADAGDRTTPRGDLAVILANEREYLARMDGIVSLYEAEARGHADRLRWTGWAVTGLALLSLAAIGRFVLVPASRLIGRQVTELGEAKERLEERVWERTRELEVEHRERLAAEERHRRLLEQFGHVARVNTMGEMASGLAHELNQPLGAIANYVGGCLERVDAGRADPAELRVALERAQAVTLRAGEIVRRLRRFAMRHEVREEEIVPIRLVSEVVDLLRPEAERRGIVVTIETAPDLPSVTGDAVQLQQVLVNLIRNAFDAVQAARAAPTPKSVPPKVIVSIGRSPEGGVCFSVIDHGEGIPPERVGRLFDPFFSTRAEGMGMGLAISRGIVEAHGGKIDAESEPGEPTCVWFTLPKSGPRRGSS